VLSATLRNDKKLTVRTMQLGKSIAKLFNVFGETKHLTSGSSLFNPRVEQLQIAAFVPE
jgi:hypothetical protein